MAAVDVSSTRVARLPSLRPNERIATLANGRALGYAEYGDPGGTPVFAFHGTPASRLSFDWARTSAEKGGVRIISVDRPGIGITPRRQRWTLLDHATDVALLADALGIGKFGVLGWSGGGPYVLASAFVSAERLLGAVSSSGCGPIDGANGTSGMNAVDRVSLKLAPRVPWLLGGVLQTAAWLSKLSPRLAVKSFETDLSQSDVRELRRLREPAAKTMEFFVEGFRQGAKGVVQDYVNIGGAFGFRLEEVGAPIHFWQGSDDKMVPVSQFDDMTRRVPGAVRHFCPGEGHLLIYSHIDEMLAVASGRTPG